MSDITYSPGAATTMPEGSYTLAEALEDAGVTTPPDRSTYLGGSDAAAIMGISKWMTPYELWEYKTHRKVKEDDPSKARIYRRGHRLEPFIREMTIEKLQDMGFEVDLANVNRRYTDVEVPFFAAEIDFDLVLSGEVEINGELVVFDREHINADAKSVSGFARKQWGDIGTDEIPIEYAAQFTHGLGVTGRRYCLVAALRSFDDVDLFWIKADDETIVAMRAKMSEFWLEHVLKDVPPDPLTFADLKSMFPAADPLAEAAMADDEVAQKAADLKRVKAAIKDLSEQEETLTFEVAKACGDKAALAYGNKIIATWGNERFSRLDQKRLKEELPDLHAKYTNTGTQRVMRLKK